LQFAINIIANCDKSQQKLDDGQPPPANHFIQKEFRYRPSLLPFAARLPGKTGFRRCFSLSLNPPKGNDNQMTFLQQPVHTPQLVSGVEEGGRTTAAFPSFQHR
jgi:hypothetical protein